MITAGAPDSAASERARATNGATPSSIVPEIGTRTTVPADCADWSTREAGVKTAPSPGGTGPPEADAATTASPSASTGAGSPVKADFISRLVVSRMGRNLTVPWVRRPSAARPVRQRDRLARRRPHAFGVQLGVQRRHARFDERVEPVQQLRHHVPDLVHLPEVIRGRDRR